MTEIKLSSLPELYRRKNKLINQLEKDIHYLKNNNVHLHVDLDALREKKTLDIADFKNYREIREQCAELDFSKEISPYLLEVPKSNGSSHYKTIDVNIGIIADEFLFNSFKGVANFFYVYRNNYEQLAGKIDVLLVASAWSGIYSDWKGMGNPKNTEMSIAIFHMIEFFKKEGVKTVFYSKEDPTNYDYFIDIAQKCDYVFTTAVEMVEQYKKDCNHSNVYVLEFGVNPIYNNPIGMKAKNNFEGALFAGSWYEKYPHRQLETRTLFDGVLNANEPLKIIDRNFHLNNKTHFYPAKYISYISPSINSNRLQPLLKLYKWILNLNSVKYSKTMFANRVYELQAMGNLIISNYSLGINNQFPNIFLVFDQKEIKNMMENFEDIELYRHRLFGVRQVLRNHTTFHRISHLLDKIGHSNMNVQERSICVIVDEKNEKTTKMFQHQSYENKKLLTVNEVLNTEEVFDYITFFTPKYFYGEYYLEDMINAFKYTVVDFVTKDSYYNKALKVNGIENNYINKMESKYRTIFSLEKYSIFQLINNMENLDFTYGYSSDSLEFNQRMEPTFITERNKKFSVIIPTFNNGKHLYGKCFMSLRRSSMFKEMEIIIVDDGSTDDETLLIIHRLERLYDNIVVYKYEDGGSGSASRPRNKGIELSSTDYITFLDPDNEAVNDGYSKLYHEIVNSNFDLVIGNMKKVDFDEKDFNYYRDVFKFEGRTEFSNSYSKKFLVNTFFKVQSIQALIVKKDVVLKNNLTMVPKAVGQDTLFFYELIVHAEKFKLLNETVHIYYAGVEASAVNNITGETFKKYLLLEKMRKVFLEEHDLVELFMKKRLNYYFKNWYLKKLDLVKPSDFRCAVHILFEIYNLYDVKNMDLEIKKKMKKLKSYI